MKVIHLLNRYGRNGISAGITNLVREGFYTGMDLHILALAKGEVDEITLNTLRSLLGPERVTYLKDADKPVLKDDYIELSAALHTAFKRYDPDILVCSNTMALLLARGVTLFNPRLPVISFMHATTCEGAFMRAALRATSFKDSAVFGDASVTLKEIVPQIFWARPPAYTVPLVIPEIGAPRTGREKPPFNIVSLGRLHPEKNYAETIHAAALLIEDGFDFSLTIAGEGPQREELEKLIADLGMRDRILLPGYQDKQETLRNAHIYVQASSQEGLCLSFVEALGAGAVIVGTDVGGMHEYGRDRQNMYKIDGTDRDAIAQGLRRAMDDYFWIAKNMSARAIETAREHFGAESVNRQWRMASEAMTKIVAKRPRPLGILKPVAKDRHI